MQPTTAHRRIGVDTLSSPEWPEDTPEYRERQSAIMQNGNTGCHYELMRLDKMEQFHERALADVREQRREFINRKNLNEKAGKL